MVILGFITRMSHMSCLLDNIKNQYFKQVERSEFHFCWITETVRNYRQLIEKIASLKLPGQHLFNSIKTFYNKHMEEFLSFNKRAITFINR